MPIPVDQARAFLEQTRTPLFTNLFAQAHAKHVLHEVQELPENFPSFDPNLEDKVTFTVYGLLAAGCSLAEQGDRAGGATTLERAASLLQYVHGPFTAASRESAFHVLIAAMAFYAAGHYSRAFVAIRPIEEATPAARVIGAFLRKDTASLIRQLNGILLREPPTFNNQVVLDDWGISVAIARACAIALEFAFTGGDGVLDLADEQLRDATIIASAGSHPGWWWVVRLLRLMLDDLGEASPWRVLPPYFGFSPPEALGRYVRLLAFGRRPVMELWASQRAAFPLALDSENHGAVVNLRTSAGKTRVAELTILQTLLRNPTARVLYLAPFRSLALEVEQTLSDTLGWLDYTVSHLYGGSRVSAIDTELASDSRIMIATPEKARALFRAAPELFENVKLVIVDEGHLIGPSERYVRNEVFIDHLRCFVQQTGARVLLLSAVLPNPQELAEWVTGDATAVASSPWKPSAERFGLLRWNGSRVRIDWRGEVESFNPSFVEAKPLGFGGRRKPFPNNKNEAVAATAVRLGSIGPVMIFTGKAVSVRTLAQAVMLALGEDPQDHPWPPHEWKVFEAVCQEELGPDAIELRAAQVGVVCHCNRLTPQVRLALEHLMRSKPPRVIIATTTLAQGVNVGISCVIIASPYIGRDPIGKRDFWNICGRAGRAFVDGEGKILYAVDETRDHWQVGKDEVLAASYFDSSKGDRVESGLLYVVRLLRHIADQAGVDFGVLLELAANNDFTSLGEEREQACEAICDLLDDELLALHEDPLVNPGGKEPAEWVERVFRESLAVLQARSGANKSDADDVVALLRARAESTERRVPLSARRSLVSSGLPLSVAIRAHESIEVFRGVADAYRASGESFSALVAAVRRIEEWARIHARAVTEHEMPDAAKLDALREGWLGGIGLSQLTTTHEDANDICRDVYSYQLPWIIHAASQQLRLADAEGADTLAKIALLVELGVPTDLAARIFLAGVRSRAAATELGALNIAFGSSVSQIGRRLRTSAVVGQLRPLVSAATVDWLELLLQDASRYDPSQVPEFAPFTIKRAPDADILHVRRIGEELFLCTTDGRTRIAVKATEAIPFNEVANDPRVVFVRAGTIWHVHTRDPRLAVRNG